MVPTCWRYNCLISWLLSLYKSCNGCCNSGLVHCFIYGISNLVRYLQADSYHRSPWYLVQSILAIIFGIILLSSSAMSLSNTVMTILAYWLLVSGILRLLGGFQMQKINFPGAKSYKRSAYIALILGIILLVQPTLSAAIIGRFVAFILIAIGASAIYTFTRINY